MSTEIRLTEKERYALEVALDALQEDVDLIPHEMQSWQDRDWASHQLVALLERAQAPST